MTRSQIVFISSSVRAISASRSSAAEGNVALFAGQYDAIARSAIGVSLVANQAWRLGHSQTALSATNEGKVRRPVAPGWCTRRPVCPHMAQIAAGSNFGRGARV